MWKQNPSDVHVKCRPLNNESEKTIQLMHEGVRFKNRKWFPWGSEETVTEKERMEKMMMTGDRKEKEGQGWSRDGFGGCGPNTLFIDSLTVGLKYL